jgi:hypothetical protein
MKCVTVNEIDLSISSIVQAIYEIEQARLASDECVRDYLVKNGVAAADGCHKGPRFDEYKERFLPKFQELLNV